MATYLTIKNSEASCILYDRVLNAFDITLQVHGDCTGHMSKCNEGHYAQKHIEN